MANWEVNAQWDRWILWGLWHKKDRRLSKESLKPIEMVGCADQEGSES